jgi:hypothetical protein
LIHVPGSCGHDKGRTVTRHHDKSQLGLCASQLGVTFDPMEEIPDLFHAIRNAEPSPGMLEPVARGSKAASCWCSSGFRPQRQPFTVGLSAFSTEEVKTSDSYLDPPALYLTCSRCSRRQRRQSWQSDLPEAAGRSARNLWFPPQVRRGVARLDAVAGVQCGQGGMRPCLF